MKRKTIIILLILILSFPVYSRPARKGTVVMKQPDGTVFHARLSGDEFIRMTTTLEGNAIVQDKDGWWCYATFEETGERKSSGWKVGEKAPGTILSESRMIPYGRLSALASERRMAAGISKSIIGHPDSRSEAGAVRRGIIILAQFSDISFSYKRQDFTDLLNKKGYSHNGAQGCAKEYFEEQFAGKVEFSFDVSEVVTLPGKREDYGGNMADGEDNDPVRMVIEACQAADNNVDFSLYDQDKDGEIDNVFIFFAGADEADGGGDDCIWSHSWYVFDGAGKSVTLDGKQLNSYACSSELTRIHRDSSFEDILTGIGTFCHEYAHTLGLADMYDTDYEGSQGTTAGLWTWTSLMDGGNMNNSGNTPPYFNAIEREMLGICEPVRITSDGTYSLGPIEQTNTVYRLDTDHEDEYYLLECRSGEGWDSYINGRGMLVYHIDRSSRSAGYSDHYRKNLTAAQRWNPANEVNCRPDHQCADLIEADGRSDSFAGQASADFSAQYDDIRTIFFPNGNISSITPDSLPGFRFWSGAKARASVHDIRWEDGKIIFDVRNVSETTYPPWVTAVKTDVFPDAAIISFESSRLFSGNAHIEWGRKGEGKESAVIQGYAPGKYAIILKNLQPDNKTYSVSICFEADGVKGDSKSITFMTKKAPAVSWPYIYLNGVERNADGSFPAGTKLPLWVSNAADEAMTEWKFNGKPVSAEDDMYFRVSESGILKVHITMEDGREETIVKEIIIREEE